MKKILITVTLAILMTVQPFEDFMIDAMEPSDEAKNDPEFLAKYDCIPEHFLVERYFKENNTEKALDIIHKLERLDPNDRFLSTAKAKVYAKIGNYTKALASLERAHGQSFKCSLVTPSMKFASAPAVANEAVLWYNKYELYSSLADPTHASEAYEKARKLLKESLEFVPQEEFESVAARAFQSYSIFRDSFPR